jgi:hypothetical protein
MAGTSVRTWNEATQWSQIESIGRSVETHFTRFHHISCTQVDEQEFFASAATAPIGILVWKNPAAWDENGI